MNKYPDKKAIDVKIEKIGKRLRKIYREKTKGEEE
jgi:hypothetical protein